MGLFPAVSPDATDAVFPHDHNLSSFYIPDEGGADAVQRTGFGGEDDLL
jgi:hypothetical protein